MTEISFHVKVAQPLPHTLAVLRKAWQQHAQVALLADAAFLQAVSHALLAASPSAFVPHCWAHQPQDLQDAGCLVLVPPDAAAQLSPKADCLVVWSQSAEPEPDFARFARVVELVDTQAEALQAARQRWQFYQHRGYPLTHHTISH